MKLKSQVPVQTRCCFITYLFKTERSSSFLVCVAEVPLFLTLPLHVWCCLQHIALWKLRRLLFDTADTVAGASIVNSPLRYTTACTECIIGQIK